MCVVFAPDFLLNIVRRHPEGIDRVTVTGKYAKEVAESVGTILWDGSLRDIAASCLSLDPKMRPRIGDALNKLVERDERHMET